MSNFCFCVIDKILKSEEKKHIFELIEIIAKKYNCVIRDYIYWQEPVLSIISSDSYIINIEDSPKGNCELFLLPDGWFTNNETNALPFIYRARFFEDVSRIFSKSSYAISFYIGESGTNAEDYENYFIDQSQISLFLSETIGKFGVNNGIHIQPI